MNNYLFHAVRLSRRTILLLMTLITLPVVAQNVQLHYDFGRHLYSSDEADRQRVTLTYETFKADQLEIGGGTIKGAKTPKLTQASPVALAARSDLALTAQSGGKVQLVRSVDGLRTQTVSGFWTAPSCESVIWSSPNSICDKSYSSIIYPLGASVKNEGGDATATAFGKVK